MQRQAIYTESKDVYNLIGEKNEWNFHDAITKEHLHSLHPYPAKFIPQIPKHAIELWSNKGDIVYDPFCGCGTTLLEASLLGRPSIGVDNNSVAILASKAKTTLYTNEHLIALKEFLSDFDSKISNTKLKKNLIPTNPNFLYWFSDDVLKRLALIKSLIIAEEEPIKSLLLMLFSSIIVRVSYQDSDTRYSRVEKMVNPLETDMAACFLEWSRVLKKGGRCLVVIGDAIVSKQPVMVADNFVKVLENMNMSLSKRWIRELHSTSRAFNVKNSRMTHEHVLLFEKY